MSDFIYIFVFRVVNIQVSFVLKKNPHFYKEISTAKTSKNILIFFLNKREKKN